MNNYMLLRQLNETMLGILSAVSRIADALDGSTIDRQAEDAGVCDMKGTPIVEGSHVSDGLGGGTVVKVHDHKVWFTWEYGDGATNKNVFNRPDNLIVIPEYRWKMVVG